MQKQKFISIIWWYHKQIFSFPKEQNYHMFPLELMKEKGYLCEIFAIRSQVKIEEDPNYIHGVKVIYYKNLFQYISYLFQNRGAIIYSNTITLKTLLVGMIWKKTVFYPHAYLFWNSFLKKKIVSFFYFYFTKIRVNNTEEKKVLDRIRKDLWQIVPLNISSFFYKKDFSLSYKKWVFIWNLTEIKNPLFVLDAIEFLQLKENDFQIYFIGEDRINFSWEVKRRNLEEHCILLWFQTPKQIQDIFSQTSFFINTSHSEWQCIASYEAALAWKQLFLPKSISFFSVFLDTALYHETPLQLAQNIELFFTWKEKKDMKVNIEKLQQRILQEYDSNFLWEKLVNLFSS